MGRPKQLLEWRGRSFLERQICLYREAGCAVCVVLGHEADKVLAACPALSDCQVILNPRPEAGMFSSLQLAAGALPTETPAFFFTPADNPGVAPETLRTLMDAWRGGARIVIPRYGGRKGHPALVDGALLPELRHWPAGGTAKSFIAAQAGLRVVDCADPAVIWDVDTPEDYAALLKQELRQ